MLSLFILLKAWTWRPLSKKLFDNKSIFVIRDDVIKAGNKEASKTLNSVMSMSLWNIDIMNGSGSHDFMHTRISLGLQLFVLVYKLSDRFYLAGYSPDKVGKHSKLI